VNQQVQGGLLLILMAIGLFVLWTRGFLADWIGKATGALGGVQEKKPFSPWTTATPGFVGSKLTGFLGGQKVQVPGG
jgi:hypothetical protein